MHVENKNKSSLRNRREKRKRPSFATVIGMLMGFIFTGYIFCFVRIINYDGSSYYTKAENLLNYFAGSEYATVYSRISSSIMAGLDTEENPEYKEIVAVAHYIEAEAQYNMYLANGMTEYLDYYSAKMEEAKADMGGLDFTIEGIDEMLLLTE